MTVVARGIVVGAVGPTPTRRRVDGSMQWNYGPDEAASSIRVWLVPSGSASLLLHADSKDRLLLQPAFYVLWTLLCVAWLACVLRRHRRVAAWAPLYAACVVSLVFGALVVVAWTLQWLRAYDYELSHFPGGVFDSTTRMSGWYDLAGHLEMAACGCALACIVAAREGVRRRTRWLLAAVGACLGLLLWEVVLRSSPEIAGPANSFDLVVAACAAAALYGILGTIRASWPRRGNPSRVAGIGFWSALCVATVWLTYRWREIGQASHEVAVSQHRMGLMTDDRLAFLYSDAGVYAREWVLDMPFVLVTTIVDLVPLIVLAAAARALYRARPDSGIVFGADRDPAAYVIIFLFAQFVGGSYVQVLPPVAALGNVVALVLLLLIIRPASPTFWRRNFLLAGVPSDERARRAIVRMDAIAAGNEFGDAGAATADPEPTMTLLWNDVQRASASDPAAANYDAPGTGVLTRWARHARSGFLHSRPAPLKADEERHPGDLALSFGPCDSWWENGATAVRLAVPIALILGTQYVYLTVAANGGSALGAWPFGSFSFVFWVLEEIAFWLVAAFTVGALFAHLPGRTGMLKGAVVGLTYSASVLAAQLVPLGPDVLSWVYIAVSTSLYLALVGLALDAYSLRGATSVPLQLTRYYRLGDPRSLAGYVTPLVLAVLFLAQQLISGDAHDQVGKILEFAPQVLPQARGAAGG